MFRSLPKLQIAAKGLLVDYAEWAEKVADRVLSARGANAPSLDELATMLPQLTSFRDEALALSRDPGFDGLADGLQADVIAIAEESDLALSEIDALNDPDAVWASLPRGQKQALIAQMRHAPATSDIIRSRIKHEIRKQNNGKAVRVVEAKPKNQPLVITLRDSPRGKPDQTND